MQTVLRNMLAVYAVFSCASIAGANIGAVLAFLSWIYLKKQPIPCLRALIVMWISVFVSCATSLTGFSNSIRGANEELLIIVFIAASSTVLTPRIRERLSHIAVIGAAASAISGIIIYAQCHYYPEYVLMFPVHHLTVAGLMLISTVMSFTLFLGSDAIISKAVFGISFILTLANLVVSQGRSCWLGFVAAMAHALFLLHKKLIAVFAVLLIIGFFAAPPVLKDRIRSIVSIEQNQQRIYIWQSAWTAFTDRPLTGLGVNSYKKYYPEKYINPKATEKFQGHAHNNFLHMLCERGITGFAAFCFLFGSLFVTLHKEFKIAKGTDRYFIAGACAVLTGFIISGLFEYNYADNIVIMFLWFWLGLALNRSARNNL